ncbi:tetratricopeptide repeat protein [Pseudomonas xanthosomatis]|uniref:tetratricopeptide repeat protein n=1 Tax=Pseudomonas xanthosomatis TaxID=2842356 RepID=UPI001C3D0EA2|nr:tetratricopeptide repeat protein [Pseudomonas xanthosomatis]QXH44743.1 tetratricopeptide repeat protein [Pseudomonas xanthosomatis]
MAAEHTSTIQGAKGSIKFSAWEPRHSGWFEADYTGGPTHFKLYDLPGRNNSAEGGWVFYATADDVSPGGKYLMLQRVEFATVINDEGQKENAEQAYCDAVDLDTGCVVYSDSIQQCEGSWQQGKWHSEVSGEIDFSHWLRAPGALADYAKSLAPEARTNAISRSLLMGVDSYTACYPVSKANVASYNDLGFYMAQGGEHAAAMAVYEKLMPFAPERAPLKLNAADSLWALGKKIEALKYYRDYRETMAIKGQLNRVPARVNERLQ